MSMTVVMNEAGMLELPPSVRQRFNLVDQTQLELDVLEDRFTLRPSPAPDATDSGQTIRQGRIRVFTGGPPLSDQDIISAIAADRDERANSIAR